ncbi:MAG: hypothetical protein IKL55_03660 [Clostridia bacterium]|nr:hypothetical protein [Clostridia bacterium]
MAFDMNIFSKKIDSTMNSVRGKYAKAYKVVELTAKGMENPEIENEKKQEVSREFDD